MSPTANYLLQSLPFRCPVHTYHHLYSTDLRARVVKDVDADNHHTPPCLSQSQRLEAIKMSALGISPSSHVDQQQTNQQTLFTSVRLSDYLSVRVEMGF